MQLATDDILGRYSLAQIEAALDRRDQDRLAEESESSLRSFAQLMWPVLHPPTKPLIIGWAFDAICDHLQAVSSGEIRRLLINVPPGFSKSFLSNVFFPAWEWGPRSMPWAQYVSFSYAQSLTIRDNIRARRVIQSEIYQRYWGDGFELAEDENAKVKFANDANGYKIATSVGGTGTGERGDRLTCDDPNNVKEAESEAKTDEALHFHAEVLPSRTNDAEKSAFITIQQRTGHRDVSSQIIKEIGNYEELILPMEHEAKYVCYTRVKPSRGDVEPERMRRVVGDDDPLPRYVPDEDGEVRYRQDPRTEEGELLHPERYSREYLETDLKPRLRSWGGSHAEESQLQQRPSPRGGDLFKREWFEFVDAVPAGPGVRVRGWDLAGTKKKRSPFTAGVRVWFIHDTLYIEHVKRERWNPGEVKTGIKNLTTQDGYGSRVSIPQDPGQAGKAQVAEFAKDLHGYLVHFSPETGDKETRARVVAAQAEVGNVKIVRGPWNEAFLAELEKFPRGDYADQVDALSRAYACAISAPKPRPPSVAAYTIEMS